VPCKKNTIEPPLKDDWVTEGKSLRRNYHYWSHLWKQVCRTKFDNLLFGCSLLHFSATLEVIQSLGFYCMIWTSNSIIWQSKTLFIIRFGWLNHMNTSISQSYSKLIRLKRMCSNCKRIDIATAQANQTMFSSSRITITALFPIIMHTTIIILFLVWNALPAHAWYKCRRGNTTAWPQDFSVKYTNWTITETGID